MSATIKWSLSVEVSGGPKVSTSRSISVEAYDIINVVIPAGDGEPGEATVEVQPGQSVDQVQFLLISADQYDESLTYKVSESGDDIKLDTQQLFVGVGALGLLGEAAPQSLAFSNGLDKEVSVQILVGRKAIAPEEEITPTE